MTVKIELSADREAAFRAHAQALGLSVEQWLLRLAEEAEARPGRPEDRQRESRPIWEVIAETMKDVPREDLAQLPRDGASQIDHYLYGTPKSAE